MKIINEEKGHWSKVDVKVFVLFEVFITTRTLANLLFINFLPKRKVTVGECLVFTFKVVLPGKNRRIRPLLTHKIKFLLKPKLSYFLRKVKKVTQNSVPYRHYEPWTFDVYENTTLYSFRVQGPNLTPKLRVKTSGDRHTSTHSVNMRTFGVKVVDISLKWKVPTRFLIYSSTYTSGIVSPKTTSPPSDIYYYYYEKSTRFL